MKSRNICLNLIKQKLKENKYLLLIPLGLIVAVVSLFLLSSIDHEHSNNVQKGIASQVIRFHVIANSDSKEDQDLKLKIKDNITNSLEPLLNKVDSVEDARKALSDNLHTMERLANETIVESGFSYSAKASIENVYFPLRVYGDIALPPGEYESVRVELGNASGENWWCIMFPPLCFVDSTYSVVPDSSKEHLEEVLTNEEYNEILIEDNDIIDVKPKFKILTFLNDVFDLD